MATTPELQEPQIAAARAEAWHQAPSISSADSDATDANEDSTEDAAKTGVRHQAGAALLTLEAAREFVGNHGLVLFAPRPLGAPAPSVVEATLGMAKPSATAADAVTARGLVARLVAEGSAVPLNLLGGPGDLPDFVVSTAAFPFVFTLRGDKGWKRPPETSGAVKVTPLALRVYELLAERADIGAGMAVGEIVTEAGREVTESAISRALNELWQLLRVIPALQQGDGETRWELTTTRFLKAVKAGANAGQPTALSALVSLYLGQAFIATEEEIASFLSPLTARSRVRDVLHGLTAGRQLSEAVLEGKTVLYIPDALPDFAQFEAGEEEAEDGELEGEAENAATGEAGAESGAEPGAEGRIHRFGAGGAGARNTNLRGKPAPREGGFRKGPAGPRPASDRAARSARTAGGDRPARPGKSFGGDRPSRPYPKRADRPAGGAERGADRPSYSKPWDEERGSRPPREGFGGAEGSRPPRRENTGDRPAFPRNRPDADRSAFRRDRPAGDRPSFSRERSAGDRPPFRRDNNPSDRPAFPRKRPDGDRPPFRREGAEGERPPFRRDRPTGDRPPFRRQGAGPEGAATDRPRPRRTEGADGERPRRPFTPQPREGGYAERGGERPARGPRSDRPTSGFRPRETREGREGGPDRPRPARPGFDRPAGPRGGFSAGRPASGRSFDRPAGSFDRPARSFDRPRPPRDGEGGGERPSRPFGRGAGRPPARGADGQGRSFGDRSVRGTGGAQRGRPQGNPGDRQGPRPGGGAGPRSGGFSRGPAKGPARGGPRNGPAGDRPSARPRPEDEA